MCDRLTGQSKEMSVSCSQRKNDYQSLVINLPVRIVLRYIMSYQRDSILLSLHVCYAFI